MSFRTRRDNIRRIGTAVDVVAKEDDRVVRGQWGQALEQLVQGREIAVNVADREGPTCHDTIVV